MKGEGEMNLSQRLVETASEFKGKPAYYFMDQPTSYAEFNGAVNKFASELEVLGVKKGDHIALLLGNTPHYVIALYGAMRVGATVIPVNPIYTPDEIGYILNNGDVKVVVMLDMLVPLAEKMHGHLPKVEHFILCETEADKGEQELSSLSVYTK